MLQRAWSGVGEIGGFVVFAEEPEAWRRYATIARLSPAIATASDGSETAGIVLFIGVPPLLNGLADFLSVGLTRFLLRRGLARGLGWSSRLDALGALVIFALLGMSVFALVHHVRPQDGAAMLDLAAAFAAIRADPGALSGSASCFSRRCCRRC